MGLAAAVVGAAAIGGVASLASGYMQGQAAKSAASVQAAAADQASANTMAMYQQTNTNLAPYRAVGESAASQLSSALPTLDQPFSMTQAQLQATPGYQFTLQQGELAAQNQMAAGGLGQSGAASKGLANYATGLAQSTYNQQAQLYYQGQQNQYNMLSGAASLGENAAAQTGSQGLSATQQAGNYSTAGAAATAAGQVGSANAYSNALSGIGSSASNLATLYALSNNGMFGGSSSGSTYSYGGAYNP